MFRYQSAFRQRNEGSAPSVVKMLQYSALYAHILLEFESPGMDALCPYMHKVSCPP